MRREEPAFKIKNANLPVLILHLKTPNTAQLKAQLEARIKQIPDFFAHTPVALSLSDIATSALSPDFADLLTFMRANRMNAIGIMGGSAAQQDAASQAGLGLIPEPPLRPAPLAAVVAEPEPEPESEPEPEIPVDPGLNIEVHPMPIPHAHHLATEMRPTLVITKPVRTGQRVHAEGANLVVLAIVNAGAELIADGDIHIYAPLRGRALAGARGNTTARIYVQSMEAELVAIAGYFQVFDEGLPEEVRGKFSQICLDGERIVVTPMADMR